MDTLTKKRELLGRILLESAPVLIAYSGGVDSAYLLAEARKVLSRSEMLGVIADSPSLPRRALENALTLAKTLDVSVEVARTAELANPDYAQNPLNRCYFCKAELFQELERIAETRRFRTLAYGENADDLRQLRPGRLAASEFSVIAPLRDAGLTKEEIRQLSREMGLPTADSPAQPCLSSRIPHGTPVTVSALAMVESGEEWVRNLGFSVFRVRHIVESERQTTARLQISPPEMFRIEKLRGELESGLKAVGYSRVEIDPEGYRTAF